MSPTLIDLEDTLIEKLREGKVNGETFQFTLLKALRDTVPTADQPEYLAMLYAASPYTLDQFDEGGKVGELLYHNVRRHLTDYAKHWHEVTTQPAKQEDNIVHPTEWR